MEQTADPLAPAATPCLPATWSRRLAACRCAQALDLDYAGEARAAAQTAVRSGACTGDGDLPEIEIALRRLKERTPTRSCLTGVCR